MNKRSVTIDVIEQKCKHTILVKVLLLSQVKFAKMIRSDNPLANRVFPSNQYKNEKFKFSLNFPVVDEKASNIGCVPHLWFERSVTFFKITIFQQFLGNYGMAAFCLHHAAEHGLIFLNRSIIGIKLVTHNLDRLLKFVKYRSATEIFILSSRKNIIGLRSKNAYIDYRYKLELVCDELDIDYLMREIAKLIKIADGFCLESGIVALKGLY